MIHDAITANPTELAPSGGLIADDTNSLDSLSFSTNEFGFAEAQSTAHIDQFDAFLRYDRLGYPDRKIVDNGLVLYNGRVEDISIKGNQISQASLGYIRALSDIMYIALWSKTTLDKFEIINSDMFAGVAEKRYVFDFDNRIFIGLRKNILIGIGTDFAMVGFRRPSGSSTTIVGISFDYAVNLPTNFQLYMQTRGEDYAVAGAVSVLTLTSAGALLTGAVNFTFTGVPSIDFLLYNNTGGAYGPNASEDGVYYIKITNLRIVATVANRINTTLSANRNAGVNVTATVGSTARMYVGQELQIGNNVGATTSETVVVLSIGSSTQFNATFVYNHVTGDTVQAHVVYADEIIKHLITTTSGINPAQLSARLDLIQSPGFDLLNEVYEDKRPIDVVKSLISKGDNQTIPRMWEFQVWEDKIAVFRPRNSASRTWLIDVPLDSFEVQRTLQNLYNLTYATYQESKGRTLRTAESSDLASQTKYSVLRTSHVDTKTTSATQATIQQNAELADKKDPIPRISLPILGLFDASGAEWPLYMPRAGDQIIIRNLPPTLTTAIDRIRSFRLIRTKYDVMHNALEVEPEGFLPSLPSIILMQSRKS